MNLLMIEGVTAFYGASQALHGVDLSVGEGQAVALMGRNGMGKTTTIRALSRMIAHREGRISFAGHDIARLSSHAVARLGLGLVPEGRRCFAPLTVRENLTAAARPGHWTERTVAALFPVLAERAGQRAGTLSGGEQQMLAIARALMTNPRLLVLDEATEGLAPVIRAAIWSALATLKASGLSILVVDKSLAEMRGVVDACVILERGTTVWSGAPDALDASVSGRYLGV